MHRHNSYIYAIPGFIISLIIYYLLISFDPSLNKIQDGIYGMASWDNIDINARKSLFANVILGIISVATLWFFFERRTDLIKRNPQFWSDLSYLSMAGIGLLLFELIEIPTKHSLNFLFATIGLNIIWHIANKFRRMDNKSIDFIALVCSCFVVTLMFKILFGALLPVFNDLYLIIGILGLIIVFIYSGTNFPSLKPQFLQMRYSIVVAIIVALEMYQIGLHRGFELSPWLWVLLIVSIILSLIYFRGPKYIGYVLMAMSFYVFFHFFKIYEQPEDMFELANPANSYMRFFKFDEWPFIDFLSSHLLSEQIPTYIHGFLNGYDGSLDFVRYNEIVKYSIFAGVSYLFLRKLLQNDWLPVFIIIFFPFIEILLARSFAIALISPILLWKLSKEWSLKHLILVGAFAIFLLFWKIDIGIANLAASSLLIPIILYKSKNRDHALLLAKFVALTILGISILFVGIELVSSGSLWNHLQQSLAYFSADQAHGLSHLTPNIDRSYMAHYFLLPISITVILLWASHDFYKKEHKSFLLVSIIFCTVFYLFNFQRGLVRHSLLSGSDSIMSSFVYLILTLTTMYFISKKHWNVVLLASSILFIFLFKYGKITKLGIFELSYPLTEKSHIYSKSNVAYNSDWTNKQTGDLKEFMDSNFDDNATFIDLSNHPMLYFYTQRKLPSYFNQYLQNSPTDKLQKWNIQDISEMNIPVVVYSSLPPTWLDKTDGVPNALRYNIVFNHVHENYRPYKRLRNREIWLRNDLAGFSMDTIRIEDSEAYKYKEHHLKWLPSLIAHSKDSEKIMAEVYFDIPNVTDVKEAYINIIQNQTIIAKMKFFIHPENSSYAIPISWIYAWNKFNPTQFEVVVDNKKINLIDFKINS